MTYREKFREDFPTRNADVVHIFQCPRDPLTGGTVSCPKDIMGSAACRVCWDREIEEVNENGK